MHQEFKSCIASDDAIKQRHARMPLIPRGHLQAG